MRKPGRVRSLSARKSWRLLHSLHAHRLRPIRRTASACGGVAEQPLWNSSSSRLETPMSPNGRRAWRKWATRRRRLFRRLCRDLRSGAHTKVLSPTPYDAPIKRRVRKSSEGRGPRATPPRPFTPRSLVGMTRGAMKRNGVTKDARLWEYLGQKLRPCPGCVQCFVCVSCENDTCACSSHRASICAGSGVLPARKCAGCEECRGYDDGIGVIHCDGSGIRPRKAALDALLDWRHR